jgi:4,5:9,10-diseco-3-hydroxy-5,9,17-trioxoandrosta-1(10),2-diene-4-oate hydrolase
MEQLNLSSNFVDVDGIKIHYSQFGSGPYLVWLHGGGPGANGVSNYSKNFPRFENFTNIIFDLPRYGQSDKPVINGSFFQALGEYIYKALKALNVQKASFVGNSLGGATAIKVAQLDESIVDKLILMAPGGLPGKDSTLSPALLLMLKSLGGDPSQENVYGFLKQIAYDQSLLTEELLHARYSEAQNSEVIATAKQSNFLPENLLPVLENIKVPTLLIWGKQDAVLPIEGGYNAVDRLENCEFRVISKCGHWVQFEYPEWFNQAVHQFLITNR